MDAFTNSHDYVMKSQMDGGHGVYFDAEIPKMLKQLSKEQLGAFILMKKIKPAVVKNFVVRPFEQPHQEDMNCELGIFGSMIGDQCTKEVITNTVNGHCVRSKATSQNKGGINCGGGVFDSVLLFPSSEFH